MSKQTKMYVADFETTVYEGQTETEVWSAALCKIGVVDPDAVIVWNNINDMFTYVFKERTNTKIWFHNLAFDGSFILNWLLSNPEFKQAYNTYTDNGIEMVDWIPDKEMLNKTFKYVISDRGQWYSIIIKINNKFVYIYDSLKLLPFSVSAIGEAFKTKYRKLTMEYTGYRKAYGYISDDELKYIKNDVLVMSEAMGIMFEQGHKGITIGSCCLKDYKNKVSQPVFKELFPDLRNIEIPVELQTKFIKNADDFIRKSYKGGWCYLVKGKENKIFNNGTTADVNSLYPSVMHSISGNIYPTGKPHFWVGNYIPDINPDNEYFFIKVKTEFKIKENHLPCIQIKDNAMYQKNEWLTTSDIYDKKKQKYYKEYIDINGNRQKTQVTLYLTCTDWKLINDQYDLFNTEIIGGCVFYAECGLFDKYINEWRSVKENSKGAMRTLAKLFLNNLYGKLASNDDSSFKVAHLDDGILKFAPQEAHDKKVVSIACGSAVTSYARNFTIRAAQQNFYGADKHGFIYADTDSIHCDLLPDEIKGVEVSETEFLKWKLETCWDKAIFARQKTYIEHVNCENLEPIETPYNNIVCAGMGRRCKQLLNASLEGENEVPEMNEEEQEFLKTKRTYDDFKVGLTIPSKLVAKNIKGGVLLVNTTYEMH